MSQSKDICLYPGIFNPPTKEHFNDIIWLAGRPNISQVIIVIGQQEQGEISPDKKEDIFEIYKRIIPGVNINIEKSPKGSPLKYIYDQFEENPDASWYIAIDEQTARSEEFRKHFDRFRNYQIELIPEENIEKSQEMLSAANRDDYSGFIKYVPDELSKEEKRLVFDTLKSKEIEEILTRRPFGSF